jgi:glucokinase
MSTAIAPAATPSLGHGAPVLAFDVGGTDIKAALVDATGSIRELLRLPSPTPGPDSGEATVDRIATAAAALTSRHPDAAPLAVGISVPGYVDEAAGMAINSENLGWRDFPMRQRAEERIGLPVAFNHDVRSAGEAEHRLGAAAPFVNVVVMTIGTGIAGAVFINNTLYSGGGMAGEMGHSRVASGPHCACGGRGCLEAVASARAIAARYAELTGQPVDGAREVLQRMKAGDTTAAEVWDYALDALALSLSQTVALIAPTRS